MKVKTIEQMMMALESAKEVTDAFARKMEIDPFSAFEWVKPAVKAAATLKVYNAVLAAVEKSDPKAIHAYAMSMVRSLVSNGANRSTGLLDGDLRAEEIRAWNDVAQLFENCGEV